MTGALGRFRDALVRRPFLLLLSPEILLTAWLVLSGRIVRGHDGLQYFTLQYWFLGQAAAGEVPRWMPFMTHGTVANWWFSVSAGFGQTALTLIAPLLEGRDFLPLFWLGMLFDHAVLLTGSWLLARRHLSPSAALFTCATIAGGAVWFTQPWFTLHLWYALPLIVELLHRAWDSGRWRWLALAGNLLFVQTFGGLPYFIPLATFVIFLYASLAMFAAGWVRVRARLLVLWRAPHVAKAAAVLVAVVPLIASFALLKLGTGEILDNSPGRGDGGSVPLSVFVTYGGRPDAGWDANWLSLILSGTRTVDFFGYHGILTLPFAAFAVCWKPNRRVLAWSVGGLVLLGFCNGTVVSAIAWLAWPAMKWYRHLGLASALVGVWLAFLAGLGLDAFRSAVAEGHRSATRRLAIGVLGVAALLPLAVIHWDRLAYTIASALVARDDWSALPDSLFAGAVFSGAVAALGALAILRAGRGAAAPAVAALLALQVADVYVVKTVEAVRRTWVVPPEGREALRLVGAPWRPRRSTGVERGERDQIFQPLLEKVTLEEVGFGVVNWSIDSFLFRDMLDSEYRVDHWLRPYDDLLRACAGQDLEERGLNPSEWRPYAAYKFPTKACPARVLTGVDADKLQVFRTAVPVRSEREIARALQRPGFDGSALYVLERDAPPLVLGSALDAARLAGVEPVVERFDANELAVTVTLPATPGWLYYADTFHPGWKARVNGAPARVYNANLAYKAVRLEPGENRVIFRFDAPWVDAIYRLSGLHGALWFVLVGAFAWRTAKPAP